MDAIEMTPAMVSKKTLETVLAGISEGNKLFAKARGEVEALGWISYDTAKAVREAGGDPVRLERTLLNSSF